MAGFSGINVALQTLLAQQTALEITQNNVSNANTEGYHRQQAVLKAGYPNRSMSFTNSAGVQNIGTGVYVSSIQRFTSNFYDTQYRNQLSEKSKYSMLTDMLTEIEINLADSTSDSIGQRMDDFFSAWQNVATDPDIAANREDLLETANSLAEGFHDRATSLLQIQQDQNLSITQRVSDINDIAKQLSELNAEIGRSQTATTQPNALLDERDRLLDKLSSNIGIIAHVQDNGQVLVSIQGHALVIGNRSFELSATPMGSKNLVQVTWADDPTNTPITVESGEIGGLMYARDTVIEDQLAALNDEAVSLVSRVNAIHRSGYNLVDPIYDNSTIPPTVTNLNAITGLNFFAFSDATPAQPIPGIPALSIVLDPAITSYQQVAAATVIDSPGDGNNALDIANSINTTTFPTRTPPITALTAIEDPVATQGQTSIRHFNTSRVTSLALEQRHAETGVSDTSSIMSAIDDQREAVAGVNLDEEAANMVKYQRAYQAAARLMNTFDQMLELVVTNLGLVGR